MNHLELVYALIQIVPSLVTCLISIRCFCRVLDMRSNVLFGGLYLADALANLIVHFTGAPIVLRLLILNPLVSFILPVALSRGPLRKRIARTILINAVIIIVEPLSMLTFWLQERQLYYEVVDASNYLSVIITYLVTILATALVFELPIIYCGRVDQRLDAQIEKSVVALIGALSAINLFFMTRSIMLATGSHTTVSGTALVVLCASCIGCIFVAYTVFSIARREAAARNHKTYRAAQVRHERHARFELERALQHDLALRRLRHDLANQVGIVAQLLDAGDVQEADDYLAALQGQAEHLREDDRA